MYSININSKNNVLVTLYKVFGIQVLGDLLWKMFDTYLMPILGYCIYV